MVGGFAAAMRGVKRGSVALSGLVTEAEVAEACQGADYSSLAKLYTPVTTLLTFLAQLLGADGSCQQAVNGLIAERTAASKSKCSADTGGYCKARKRLPEAVPWQLMRNAGRNVEQQARQTNVAEQATSLALRGRSVRVVDGSTNKIADTEANRAEYPLMRGLEPGLHYPIVRFLVIFSLAVGTVLDAAIRPYQGKGTGETAMLRELAHVFEPGDVLLGDRYFAGYWDIAFWLQRGVDVVSRLPASRPFDHRRGKRLGPNDYLMTWEKTQRPAWVEVEAAGNYPETLLIRVIKITVPTRGFRVKQLWVITTLLEPEQYPASEIADLYRRRWQAELNIRSLKTHLGLEQLRCKTPELMRKEFATYLLAYNCVRRLAYEAAAAHNLQPHEISFKHTLQTTNEFFRRFHQSDFTTWLTNFLATLAEVQVANRPDRIEPYTIKTRPKDFPPTNEPRSAYKRRQSKNL
jgi:putative transposase